MYSKKYGMNCNFYYIVSVAIIIFVVFTLLCSCAANNVNTEYGKITVFTSFFTMYDFASKIGGEKVNIINMVPSGMEPHDWEPSPKDVAGLSKADLFIYNGAGMEGWVEKVLESLNHENIIALETSKDITLENSPHTNVHQHEGTKSDTEHSHENLEFDPHVWLNPMNAKIQMKVIKDAFIKVDPFNKQYYEQNYELYSDKLDELDNKYRKAVNSFSRKEIVVSHEAFGYLCSAYGLKQLALEGISSESEPTFTKMKEIIDFVKENDVKVIFFEELASPKVAETIARETGTITAVLNPLEGISEENLEEGKDYFAIMEENLKALTAALK